MKSQPLRDFQEARYTAVISDLHLCEAEPVHPRFPLWKKYKTSQFFFDGVFQDFVEHIVSMAGGSAVELILNGDIFDFDSVLALPVEPPYDVSWLERKSLFKFEKILKDHFVWVEALKWLLLRGHRVVFVIGNHDLELHWPKVQELLLSTLALPEEYRENVRFCDWFYISNGDTLIEHGNQYDPYCLCLDPVNPFIRRYNKVEIRLPFGNVACRYLTNGMGFFNPHVDTGYLMSLKEYVSFFVRYMVRAQPFSIWTWFWGSFLSLVQALADSLLPSLRDPLRIEDRINSIAAVSNATPRMVRELKELFVNPASRKPMTVARELWLDRAFIVLLALLALFEIFLFIKQVYDISFFWMFIPIILLVPFFLFYSRSVYSKVLQYKEPQEDIMAAAGTITRTNRIIYGHTHEVRHEVVGAIEHLNPGSWSPAFLDVECNKPIGQKTFIWIEPGPGSQREANLYQFSDRGARVATRGSSWR
jgi:UDP-2,3-diacylglucosamine pyrophosphatase LpxH